MTSQAISRTIAAVLFVAAGLVHFVRPSFYDAMIPPLLAARPSPRFWTLLSGVCEIAGGIGLLVPRLRRAAAWGLITLLVVFLWVHVRMFWDRPELGGQPVATWVLIARLPLQAVLIVWVWFVGLRRKPEDETTLES